MLGAPLLSYYLSLPLKTSFSARQLHPRNRRYHRSPTSRRHPFPAAPSPLRRHLPALRTMALPRRKPQAQVRGRLQEAETGWQPTKESTFLGLAGAGTAGHAALSAPGKGGTSALAAVSFFFGGRVNGNKTLGLRGSCQPVGAVVGERRITQIH